MQIISVISVFIAIVLMIVLSGGTSATMFLDLPSLLLIIIIVVPIMTGTGQWKPFFQAFHYLNKKKDVNLTVLNRSIEAVTFVQRLVLYGSLLLAVFSVIMIFSQSQGLSDHLLNNLSVALLPFLYGLTISLLLLPVRTVLVSRRIDYISVN